MKCDKCDDMRYIIQDIFNATGYMDIYKGDVNMMVMVIKQGIQKDRQALSLYREAGEAAVEALSSIDLTPSYGEKS